MARVCAVRQLYFPRDPKLRREVEALVEAGHEVDVVCLRRGSERLFERTAGARVFRIPIEHKRGHPFRYVAEYLAVLTAATLLIAMLQLVRRYRLLQVSTPPDSLVFAALVPRLLGVPVLLQLQEPMPEFFSAKFGTSPDAWLVRFVAFVERLAVGFASAVITCTDNMRREFVARGADASKIGVVLVSSNESEFDVASYPPRPRSPDRFELISHGSIEERYGLDTAIRAVALLRDDIPELRLRIFGEGTYKPRLQALVRELGVADRVSFSDGWVAMGDLLRAIADADAGVVAMKRDRFRDLTHNLKMFDFVTMRRPAIVSRTRSVDDYFDDSCFLKFAADDPADLARAIRRLHDDPSLERRLVERAAAVNEAYRWPRQRVEYLGTVDRLLGSQAGPDLRPAKATPTGEES